MNHYEKIEKFREMVAEVWHDIRDDYFFRIFAGEKSKESPKEEIK